MGVFTVFSSSPQRRLAICHTSPDVAVRLLTVFYKVEHLTLYCWSQRMAKWIPEPLVRALLAGLLHALLTWRACRSRSRSSLLRPTST